MKTKFPQYLSKPFQVLWFETDDLIIMLIFFVFAITFGNICWVLMFVAPYIYSKLKKKYPRGFFRHTLYFMGLINLKGYPSYFEREFHE